LRELKELTYEHNERIGQIPSPELYRNLLNLSSRTESYGEQVLQKKFDVCGNISFVGFMISLQDYPLFVDAVSQLGFHHCFRCRQDQLDFESRLRVFQEGLNPLLQLGC
jgi:hypothetical protein